MQAYKSCDGRRASRSPAHLRASLPEEMSPTFKFATFSALLGLFFSGVRGYDFQYCHDYPAGHCIAITLSSNASTCYDFNLSAIGGSVDTILADSTKGITYVVYTGLDCTGDAFAAADPILNLLYPFANNVRSASIQIPIANPYTPLGCYTDNAGGRTLAASSDTSNSLTVEICQTFCSNGGYSYAGVEYGSQCWCDYSIRPSGVITDATTCNVPCSGNNNETCGGADRINIYKNGNPSPSNAASIGNGTFLYSGCYTDNVNNTRTLPAYFNIAGGNVTPESCAGVCKANNFTIVGLEYGQECWCGDTIASTSSKVTDDNCLIACKANVTAYCGDANRLNIWSSKAL